MTLFAYLNGVDVTNQMRLADGIVTAGTAADGTPATAGLRVDDSTGVATYLPLQEFKVIETACSSPRLFTGYTLNASIDRGPYINAAGRVWEFDVPDLNFLLHRLVFTAASANRPSESVATRLAWLLATPQMSGVVNSGLAVGTVWILDAADYRGSYPDQVLQDMCVSSVSDENAFVFFVYWNQSTNAANLFFDQPTAAVNSSTLRLSNVIADVDNTTTFSPNRDARLDAAGEAIYDGVYFTTRNGSIYRQRAETYTAFGMHRDGTFSTERINLGTTAENHAAAWLLTHSGKTNTIVCSVILPASKVNLIDAGMRLQVKFSHLPGYESFTWSRVTRRSVVLAEGTNAYYLVQLELSVKGINPASVGNPGSFPYQAGNPSILQQVSGTASLVMPAAITAGSTLVVSIAGRVGAGGGGFDYVTEGYTLGPLAVFAGALGTLYKTAGVGASTTLPIGPNNRGTWYEFPGTWTPGTSNATSVVEATGNGIVMTAGPITVGTGSIAVSIGTIGTGGAFASASATLSFTPGTGWIEDLDARLTPNLWTGHAFPAAGALTATTTNSANVPSPNTPGYLYKEDVPWTMHVVEFTSSTAGNAPTPGQWVYGEIVTMAGAVGTTKYKYATGSLLVKVDGVLISRASYTETNAAAGTFTLAWTPATDEVVTVTYQGL